jgi:hypothetical protein
MQSGGSPRYELSERDAHAECSKSGPASTIPWRKRDSASLLSTFDTGYLLVSEQQLAQAVGAVFDAGHSVQGWAAAQTYLLH